MINELVQRSSEGKHGMVIKHREKPYEEIKQMIEDGYMIISNYSNFILNTLTIFTNVKSSFFTNSIQATKPLTFK